jgi:hypothetical protein
VTAFATEHGVEQYLTPLWEMSWRAFPAARKVVVFVEEDYEMPGVRQVIFEVHVPEDVEEMVAGQRRWVAGLFEICPSTLVHFFCLGMEAAK